MASCYYKPDGISLCRSGANKMEGGGGLLAVLYGTAMYTLVQASYSAVQVYSIGQGSTRLMYWHNGCFQQ